MSALHYRVREHWLAQVQEDILTPEQPIFDAHHHLWDRPEGHYRSEEMMADVHAGHDVRASLFVQCRTGYRATGPEELRPVGEVETVLDWCRDHPVHPAGIVAFADLQSGAAVAPVLDALMEAGCCKLKGIRNSTAFHSDPAIRSNPNPPPDGLLCSSAFTQGARAVAKAELVLDIWAYQTQLDEVRRVAEAVPELTVVVDHCGGPLGTGPYHLDGSESFQAWRAALSRLAALPNTRIKIGGFGLSVLGWRYGDQPTPPHSDLLARNWAPWVETCLELFGTKRAMFESNFPVDKGQFAYATLWNAFKRLAAPLAQAAQDDLFWRSAARTYRIDQRLFTNDRWRILS